MNETKSLCSVRNSPKTAVSTEPPSVTSGPERTRGEQAGQQPAALLGTAGFYPPARRSCKCSYRSRCTNGCGRAATRGGTTRRGREYSKPRRLWAGSCCKIPPALPSAPLAELPFPSRCLSATCVLPSRPQLPAAVGLHLYARLLLSQQPQGQVSGTRAGNDQISL